MKNQLDKSIIQKVKEILQIAEDLSSIELLKLLKDYRKRIHPDKFTEGPDGHPKSPTRGHLKIPHLVTKKLT